MKILRIEAQVEWSDRKVAQMRNTLLKLISIQGCKRPTFEVYETGQERPTAVKTIMVLHLACNRCAAEARENDTPYAGWYAEEFEACVRHGRKTVGKISSRRMPLPEGAVVGQVVEAAA